MKERKLSLYKRIKYRLWRVRDAWWAVKRYLKNIYLFRKELSEFYPWNYDLGLFRKTLELNYVAIKNGYEVEESKNKKLVKIARAIELLKAFENDDFISLAEKESNTEYIYRDWNFEPLNDGSGHFRMVDDLSDEDRLHNDNLYTIARRIESDSWVELWDLIKGQDDKEIMKLVKENPDFDYEKWFDGSGLRGWWN